MLPHSNGKSHQTRRKRSIRRLKPQVLLLLLPIMLLLLFIWILLLIRQVFTSSHADPVSLEQFGVDPVISNPISAEQQNDQVELGAVEGAHAKQQQEQPPGDDPNKQKRPQKKKNLFKVEDTFRIPNILTFTHSTNLLDPNIQVADEDVALQRNVRNTIKLHPDAQVHFFTDSDCIASIKRVLGDDSPLIEFFQSETHGMYKADICRGAALYETGGLYFDVDIQARMSIFQAIQSETTFVTPLVHVHSKYPKAFFQAFIGSTPQNPILLRYLELFIKHYEGHIDVQGPLGVLLLRKAHDEVMNENPQVQQVELWQEVLYNQQLFPNVSPPSWGTRRACHFVVVANRKRPYVVPLYSRVKGSRMCGGKESIQNLRGGG